MLKRNSRFLKINQLDEKAVLANDDLFVIEDSADTNKRKRVKKSNLGGVTAHTGLSALAWTSSGHTGTANRFAGFSATGAADETEKSSGTWSPQLYLGGALHNGGTRTGSYFQIGSSIIFSCVLFVLWLTRSRTATTSNGSATITNVSSYANLTVGMTIAGVGIPAGTIVSTINTGVSIVMSLAATADGAGVALTFGFASTDGVSVQNLPFTSDSSGSVAAPNISGVTSAGAIYAAVYQDSSLIDIMNYDPATGLSNNALVSNLTLAGGLISIQLSGIYTKA